MNSFHRVVMKMSTVCQSVGPLRDSYNRVHNYLRISLTERCNLRCRYCMPEEGIKLTETANCLSLPELKRLIGIFVNECGIKKVRLTGGEPTIDQKLVPILSYLNELRAHSGLETVGLTTNGLTLKRTSSTLKDLGLNMVNISLDTLNSEKFEQITRRKGLKLVLNGLESAVKVGFDKVKLNCVVMRGVNDQELGDFARLPRMYPIEVRFIEFMPFMGNKWARNSLISCKQMYEQLSRELPNLLPVSGQSPCETSKLFREPNAKGSIGFISSMTDNFCGGCNRLRLTADGNLKVCLFGRAETSLRDLMRNGASDLELIKAIRVALWRKDKQHAGLSALQRDVSRPMIKIDSRSLHSSSSSSATTTTTGQENPDGFSHLNAQGQAKMVNVGPKECIKRIATARGEIFVGQEVLQKITSQSMPKGDILTVSKIAGIMGAKLTSSLIPMCHHIALDHVQVDLWPADQESESGILIAEAKVEANHKTGVEMESLTAVSITLLTIYDMCKSVGGLGGMRISNIRLIHKDKLLSGASASSSCCSNKHSTPATSSTA